MGIFSSTISVVRYSVEGELAEPITETVASALQKNVITDIDDTAADTATGWTTVDNPMNPLFGPAEILFGTHFVFSLRIDKKSIPAKVIKKYHNRAVAKRLAETGRDTLSKSEKKDIKERVLAELSLRIPAVPNTYDLIWNYEAGMLWFLSTQKGANETLETLFANAFDLTLIRLFGYTMAHKTAELSAAELDMLNNLNPTVFRS